MKLIIILLLILFTNKLWAYDSCIAITNENLCIELEWVDGPYLGAYSKNIVLFKDLNTSTDQIEIYKSPSESVQFFGWMIMASHQHGTRPLATQILEDGIYENSKIFYMGGMMGTWQFKVKVGNEEFVLHALDV